LIYQIKHTHHEPNQPFRVSKESKKIERRGIVVHHCRLSRRVEKIAGFPKGRLLCGRNLLLFQRIEPPPPKTKMITRPGKPGHFLITIKSNIMKEKILNHPAVEEINFDLIQWSIYLKKGFNFRGSRFIRKWSLSELADCLPEIVVENEN
jgi:hypothetical protein